MKRRYQELTPARPSPQDCRLGHEGGVSTPPKRTVYTKFGPPALKGSSKTNPSARERRKNTERTPTAGLKSRPYARAHEKSALALQPENPAARFANPVLRSEICGR